MSNLLSRPAWLRPQELFEWVLDEVQFEDGMTARDKLDKFREGESFEYHVFSIGAKNNDDRQIYLQHKARYSTANDLLLKRIHSVLVVAGQEGGWIAYGRRAPTASEEIIPPKLWYFLNLDIATATATSEANGLRFAGLRMLIYQDLSPEWQERVNADIERVSARGDDAEDESNHTAKAETECRDWLVGLMNSGPKDRAKPAYQSEAKHLFGTGSRAFGRAWDAAIEKSGNTAWSDPGRIS